MKLKRTLIMIIMGAFFASCFASIADPIDGIEEERAQETFEFHPDEVHIVETEATSDATGPEVVEYYEYKEDDNKVYKPGSFTDFDFSTIGKGLFYDGVDFYFFLDTGVMATNYMRNIEGDMFLFGEDGKMVKSQLIEYENELYYFDVNGAMYKNRWHTEEEIDEADRSITYTTYYFGPTGRAYRAGDDRNGMVVKTIDGEKFGFNENGEKLEGYYRYDGTKFDPAEDAAYEDSDYYFDPQESGAATTGWHYYEGATRGSEYDDNEELVLYYDPKTAKKVRAKSNDLDRCVSRIIDGERYMFDKNGIRRNKWYKAEIGRASHSNTKYFSDEFDGHLQKGWFTAVPGAYSKNGADLILDVNKKRHQSDEEMWFYAGSNGNILRNVVRKIGSYTYAFDADGVMQQNAFVKVKNGAVIKAYDCDYLTKANIMFDPKETDGNAEVTPNDNSDPINLDKDKGLLQSNEDEKWMYFLGEDFGESKVGSLAKQNSAIVVEVSDDEMEYYGNNAGAYSKLGHAVSNSGTDLGNIFIPVERNKKYIQNGIILKKHRDDNNYGIVREQADKVEFISGGNKGSQATIDWRNQAVPSKLSPDGFYKYIVVNSSGERVTATNKSFKDSNGDYIWVGIQGEFIGLYAVQGRFTPNAKEVIHVDKDGNRIGSSADPNWDYSIGVGDAYWSYKEENAKEYKYGMPKKESRYKCNDLAINYGKGSLISDDGSGDIGPYVNGLASAMYP